MVKYLIETCKAGPYIKKGSRALNSAAWGSHLELVKYLIETCKVDPYIKNGDKVLQLAA